MLSGLKFPSWYVNMNIPTNNFNVTSNSRSQTQQVKNNVIRETAKDLAHDRDAKV